jgi:hypothetical protein
MRLNKLSGKKNITVSKLLEISDRNETSSTIVELLDDVRKEMRNFDSILVVVQGKKGIARWEYGFSSKDIVYLVELIKQEIMLNEMIGDDYHEEDDDGADV